MHSSDLSIITPYAAKTFLNVRCSPCRHILLNPTARPKACGPTVGKPLSLPGLSLPFYQGGGLGVNSLALTVGGPKMVHDGTSLLCCLLLWCPHECLDAYCVSTLLKCLQRFPPA